MREILNELYPDDIQKDYKYTINDYDYLYSEETIENILGDDDDDDDFENVDEDKLYEDCEDIEVEERATEEKPKHKRGRKPKDRIYFGEEQELAVIEYIEYSRTISALVKQILLLKFGWTEEWFDTLFAENKDLQLYDLMEDAKLVVLTNEEDKSKVSAWEKEIGELQVKKNAIFNEKLKPAFKKMVEAIIRGQELYIPNEEFLDTYTDTLSHLLSKADKFDSSKGKRAYSYYSNICKNYLIGKREKTQKMLIRNPSYDALELDFSNDISYSTNNNDKSKRIAEEEVNLLTQRINEMISSPNQYGLKDNEVKIGKALITLFKNWDYVLSTDNSSKLNKSVVLLFLREHTGLDTKGVRDNLKKFKKEFLIIKDFIIN